MKLYELMRSTEGTWVRVLEGVDGPPSAQGFKKDDVVLFYHIDGSYSLCRNRGGELVHLKAWAEVELIDEGEVWE